MTRLLTGLLLSLMATFAVAQPFITPTQTIRGTVLDAVSHTPLPGATVVLAGTNPLVGTTTDSDGRFRLSHVPVGRVRLNITMVGYEELDLNEILVNAGKEIVLELPLTESLRQLDEVTVTYQRTEDRTVANNEFATVSARAFNATETLRYAGSVGDPSRMVANFAGVSGANDSRNDIIVRGNSPATLLWRLDGVNIPNPNHFGSLGTTGGPVSMLNANLLAKSDFLTGAFPAQYANALGSVFDVRLRKGNDEQHEFLGQVAFNGFELGAEGPYSQRSKASYLLNVRYSFLGLLKRVGFQLAGAPVYQDGTFKTDLPVGKRGNLSVWAIAGKSNVTFLGKDVNPDKLDTYGNENTNTRTEYSTVLGAVAYEHRFSGKTIGRITLSGSRINQHYDGDTVLYQVPGVIGREIPSASSDFRQQKLSLNTTLSHKFSSKDRLASGLILDGMFYQFQAQQQYPRTVLRQDEDGETALWQAYSQWQHRFSDRLTLNTGLSWLYLALNGSSALEPRVGLSYRTSATGSLNVAYGLHSSLQPLLTYFYQTQQADGSYAQTNRNLGFTRGHHLVVGYDQMLTPSLRLKLEAYYQWLFQAPVERTASSYSTLTEGVSFAPSNKANLVNGGTGRNYGLELTLEQFFQRNYYFLVTASVYNSTYKGSDGLERNTPFNNRYVLNLLTGREWRVGAKNNVLVINWKLTTTGGRYVTPINTALSADAGYEVDDNSRAFSSQQPAYFRTDLKIGFRMNRPHTTQEFALDLQNMTNHQNVFQQAYNPRTNQIGTAYQQGFFPVPFYRLTF